MGVFKLHSEYQPAGDQPQAIAALSAAIRDRDARYSTLQGVTGSGKTFTMANIIAQLERPTLVISHNKTLAAQLYSELKGFFPENAVEAVWRRMLEAGCDWPDHKPEHFFVTPELSVGMIDLERMAVLAQPLPEAEIAARLAHFRGMAVNGTRK